MGFVGVMLVIVCKDLLGKVECIIFIMFNYEIYIKKDFFFNIFLVFFIFVSMFILCWVKEKGGVEVMVLYNEVKVKIIYDVIDNSLFFEVVVIDFVDCFLMNVIFVLKEEFVQLEVDFLVVVVVVNCSGIKGYCLVGGF